MLLDNKTPNEENEPFKVIDFLSAYLETGKLDVVTGYVSVSALALLGEKFDHVGRFRLILGSLLRENQDEQRIIDLIRGDAGVQNTLKQNQLAEKAVGFLEKEKVHVKNIQKNFCHAKTYIYKDSDTRK